MLLLYLFPINSHNVECGVYWLIDWFIESMNEWMIESKHPLIVAHVSNYTIEDLHFHLYKYH